MMSRKEQRFLVVKQCSHEGLDSSHCEVCQYCSDRYCPVSKSIVKTGCRELVSKQVVCPEDLNYAL